MNYKIIGTLGGWKEEPKGHPKLRKYGKFAKFWQNSCKYGFICHDL